MKPAIAFFLLLIFISSCSPYEGEKIIIPGVENPVISLDGEWNFSDIPAEKAMDNYSDSSLWSKIIVPGECAMQGYAIKHDSAYLYHREINIPADYAEKVISLKFHGVYSRARVWVNDKYIRSHNGGFTAWECDITEYVVPGEKADLLVEIVDNRNDISFGSGYAKHQIGGILRSVELFALPADHLDYINIETELDNDYSDAVLKLSTYYTGMEADMEIELFNPEGRKVRIPVESARLSSGVNDIEIKLNNPEKWDSEHPSLYSLRLTLRPKNKNPGSIRNIKVGFRELRVSGNKLLVNGDPVKLRGACRHDIHPLLGRTTDSTYDLKDVLLAREANINFIRTSHYPPSEAFLDYCDKYGIYVEDETAVCFVNSHRTEGYGTDEFSGVSDANQYLSQVREMLYYHRNHPSIIIWSIGNENSYNNNFKLSYDLIKESDPTRPVIFSYPGAVPDTIKCYDILSMHYPSYTGDVNNQWGISVNNFDYDSIPVLFDEWAHVACYNKPTLQDDPGVRNFWGESLDKMWSSLWESEGGLGGAIWGYIDETFMLPLDNEGYGEWGGIMDEEILPSMYEGHCVGYGEWGIIDTWRRKKPEFWNTRKAYSPVKVLVSELEKNNDNFTLPLINRFNHTNLNELSLIWSFKGEKITVEGVDLKPGEAGEIQVPDFDYSEGDLIHLKFVKEEHVFDEYDIKVKEAENKSDTLSRIPVMLVRSEKGYIVSGKNFNLGISSRTGRIENLITGVDTLLKEGPFPRIVVPGEYIFYSTIKMKNLYDNWILEEIRHEEEEGLVNFFVSGNYGSLPVNLEYQISGKGMILISYYIDNIIEETRVQEAGLSFKLSGGANNYSWERNAYWSYYPQNHPAAATGEVDLSGDLQSIYRIEPEIEWAGDASEFYYYGIKNTPSLSRSARMQRENIISCNINYRGGSSLYIDGSGDTGLRMEKDHAGYNLFLNSAWDYTSLLWGNYDRRTYLTGTLSDKISFTINKTQ